jgi:hypothetical protein
MLKKKHATGNDSLGTDNTGQDAQGTISNKKHSTKMKTACAKDGRVARHEIWCFHSDNNVCFYCSKNSSYKKGILIFHMC